MNKARLSPIKITAQDAWDLYRIDREMLEEYVRKGRVIKYGTPHGKKVWYDHKQVAKIQVPYAI